MLAGFIAEVGDITRFDNTKELQKLAGLELVADSSGKHNGRTKISKRGRKRLRYLLFEGAILRGICSSSSIIRWIVLS